VYVFGKKYNIRATHAWGCIKTVGQAGQMGHGTKEYRKINASAALNCVPFIKKDWDS